MAGIVLKNISKVYQSKKENFKAVDGFNLEINDNEFIVLVGPSGCGKSTTLRMIAGLEEISDGELYIDGRMVNNLPPKDRDIAMVFQNYALYPYMSVFQNMAFGLTIRRVSKAEIRKKVLEAANILGLESLLKRKPKSLSGGQCQRVALGRAIVRHPKVFLLDEPLSNLDAKLRTQMRTEISKLHKRVQTTFVYVTHDQTEAMTMADRIVVMKDGVIQQVDTPANLYKYPCNLFVAGFIGSPQMNFVEGKLNMDASGAYIQMAAGQEIRLPKKKAKNIMLGWNQDVTVGIRPEDILEATPGSDSAIFTADVDIAEVMGSEVLAYFEFAGSKMIARLPAETQVKGGGTFSFCINTEKIHLFDHKTGKMIGN